MGDGRLFSQSSSHGSFEWAFDTLAQVFILVSHKTAYWHPLGEDLMPLCSYGPSEATGLDLDLRLRILSGAI